MPARTHVLLLGRYTALDTQHSYWAHVYSYRHHIAVLERENLFKILKKKKVLQTAVGMTLRLSVLMSVNMNHNAACCWGLTQRDEGMG